MAIWAAIPLLTPYVRQICGLEDYRLRPRLGSLLVKGTVKALQNPIFDRVFIPYFGPEMWGYLHNVIRHADSTGFVEMTHDPGLTLQHGKRGTMCPFAVAGASI